VSINGAADLWDRLFGAQPDPPALLVLVTALIALVAVAVRPLWRVARNAITIAHEGGHALSAGRPSGPGMILTLLAGYIAPSLVGLGGAWILGGNRITLLLWLAVVLLLLMLINIRNVFGALSVIVTGAIVVAVSWYASPQVQAAFAYAAVWFLLIGGVRPVGELQRLRSRGRMPDSDADQLARLTHVPAVFWVFMFGLVSVAVLVTGTFMLAGQWLPAVN
jgi:hypothetical protein